MGCGAYCARRSAMQRVHGVIVAAAPTLKPRIWYGTPAYATSASTPALITLRNDERLNLAITEKAAFRAAGGGQGADAGCLVLRDGGRRHREADRRDRLRWRRDVTRAAARELLGPTVWNHLHWFTTVRGRRMGDGVVRWERALLLAADRKIRDQRWLVDGLFLGPRDEGSTP